MIPNWKRIGFKSQEEGIAHILTYLKKNEGSLAGSGFGEATIQYGNLTLMLKATRDRKKKKK